MKNLYDVLEVSRVASAEAIAAAHQRLLQQLQDEAPADADSGPAGGISARRDAVTRAYRVLADPGQRKEYDERLDGSTATRPEPPDGRRKWFADARSYVMQFIIPALVVALPLATVIYIALDRDAKSAGVATPKENGAAEPAAMIESAAQERRLELENERLKQQIEVLRLEPARRDRELEYSAQERDRLLRIEEKRQELAEKEIQADRAHIDRDSDRQYQNQTSQDIVDNLNRTVELQKDAAAARLGITRQQYNRLEQEKWREGSGSR